MWIQWERGQRVRTCPNSKHRRYQRVLTLYEIRPAYCKKHFLLTDAGNSMLISSHFTGKQGIFAYKCVHTASAELQHLHSKRRMVIASVDFTGKQCQEIRPSCYYLDISHRMLISLYLQKNCENKCLTKHH